jgi:choline dehydrogenase
MHLSFASRRALCRSPVLLRPRQLNPPRDNHEKAIDFPVYIGCRPHPYEWDVPTTPQTQLDGVPCMLVLGKGVGGGSLINGLLWNRGGGSDFDAWAQLGNPGWDWEGMVPYFMKSETYTPRVYDGLKDQPIKPISSVHGSHGPVNVSYPDYFWPQLSKCPCVDGTQGG